MPSQTFAHWAILCHPAWGHVRHFNGFIVRVLRRYRTLNVRITFLVHHTHAAKAKAEVSQLLDEDGETIEERERLMSKVRFVGLAPTKTLLESAEYQKLLLGSTTSIRYGMEVQSAFSHVWLDVLTSDEPERMLRCAATGQDYSYNGWPRPSALHTDIYGGPILRFVREQDDLQNRKTEKIYHWSTEFISFWRMFRKDDKSQGGIEDEVTAILNDPVLSAALPPSANFVELCWERYNRSVNQLLCYPGMKYGMYDCEIHPGQVGWLRTYIPALNKMKLAMVEADGIVIASSAALQPIALPQVKQWLEVEEGKKLYAIGPAIEDNLLAEEPRNIVVAEKDANTDNYLTRAQHRFGAKSVMLLSWGTIWAPFKYPEILEAWIDEALTSGRPFILNRSAELFSSLSPWIEAKLDKAVEQDIVHQTTWINQRAVLRHPALGVFVSHCGYSSFSESTVPIIGWPSFFDQSINAQIGVDLNIGWQLYQVRGQEAAKRGDRCKALEMRGEELVGTIDAVRQEARRVINESRHDQPVYQEKAKRLKELRRAMRQEREDDDLRELVA